MFGYALKHPITKADHLVRNNREFTSLTLSCLLGRWAAPGQGTDTWLNCDLP